MTIGEKLTKIAENEKKVYDAGEQKGYFAGYKTGYSDGHEKGFSEGKSAEYSDGYEQGKKEEYDAFWDAFQNYGKRMDYQGGFYGSGWNDSNFKPKYDMKPNNCSSMFISSKITDLCAALDGCGVTLDTSASARVDSMYYYSGITKVPTLDTRQAANLDSTFRESKVESVEKILLKDDGSQRFNNSFVQATALKDITFDGVIGLDINFQHSTKLSADSIISIITHLSDTAQGKTLTLSRTAVENAIANGEFGGDTVYMTTDGAFSEYLYSNPIPLSKGQTIKITFDMEEGHDFYSDSTTDWWFGSAGLTAAGGTPNHKSGWTWTATQDDEQVVLMWYFDSKDAVSNIPIKTRAVLVDEDGNEITGENLHSFAADTVPNNGTTLTIAEESWETLYASKPAGWEIDLV